MTENNGWPGKPGVPMNPEQDSEGHVWRVDGVMDIYKWVAKKQRYEKQRGYWVTPDQLIADRDTYFGRIVTPAEVEARIAAAHKEWLAELNHDTDALEEAAKWHDEQAKRWQNTYAKETLSGPDMQATRILCLERGGLHIESAAAIRALKGEGDE